MVAGAIGDGVRVRSAGDGGIGSRGGSSDPAWASSRESDDGPAVGIEFARARTTGNN